MPFVFASICGLVALGLVGLGSARAEPWVQVRARTMFDALQASARGQDVRVEGSLRDNLGMPVAGSPVVIAAAGARVEVASGADGRFGATLALQGSGEVVVSVGFGGSELLDAARAELPVTIGRNALRLRIDAPDEVEAGRPVPIAVVAVDGREVAVGGLRLQLEINAQPWQQAQTDARGRVTRTVPPLPSGVHRLRARFEGSRLYLPAVVERSIESARPLEVALAAAGAPAAGDPVVLDATLGAARPTSVRVSV